MVQVSATRRGAGLAKPVALSSIIMDFLAGKATPDQVSASYLKDPRVKTIITTTAIPNGVGSLVNDLMQDTLVIFWEKYMKPGALKLSDPDSVYSLVFSLGHGAAQTKRKDLVVNRGGVISLDEHMGDDSPHRNAELEIIVIDDSFEEGCLGELDVSRSCREIERLLSRDATPMTPMNQVLINILDEKLPASPPLEERAIPSIAGIRLEKNVTDKRLSTDQKELKQIRKDIGMKLDAYAAALGISEASLLAYIYGRTVSVPEDVMTTARALYRQHLEGFKKQAEMYENKSMEEILDAWCEQIGITRDAKDAWVDVIADYTSRTAITVKRWLQKKYRPNLRSLIEYGTTIEEQIAQRKLAESKRNKREKIV